jgi:putative oxidoreductase
MSQHSERGSISLEGSSGQSGSSDLWMLIGRILLAQIYVVAGIRKALALDYFVKYMSAQLPVPEILIYLVILLEVGGGLLFILGWKTRQLAVIMAIFTLAAGILFHGFWSATDAQYNGQLNNFMKNLAIVAGFIAFALHGPGRLSLDRR